MTNNFINDYQQRIEKVLQQLLPDSQQPPKSLHEAMRYAVLDSGKRMRPLLVYATGLAMGATASCLDAAAAAVELIHCYSLIHDDLPSMDNDDLRRGKPTCHKAFDEATAMLAGDALQTEAFTLLVMDLHNTAEQRVAMLTTLGQACGSSGMAGGQAIDLAAAGQLLNLSALETMHRLKTGALIRASVHLGVIVANVDTATQKALDIFAMQIGLAFQIRDDILDVEGETNLLGKQQGADAALNKPTYPSIVGLEKAKQLAHVAYEEALAAIVDLPSTADDLRELAHYIVQRDY